MPRVWLNALIFGSLALVAITIVAVPAIVWGPGYLRHREEMRLRADGLPARAVILGLEDTGNRFNDTPEIIVRLQVRAEGRSPWPASVRRIISLAEMHAFTPGREVAVRYDPHRPDRVALTP
ncbi:hypothetical protein GXW78_19115 [Roseomonas terrae]|uniref:DUF3592 domain-containing protein n=1 Tax=Neoroseomonas terrae TaxID=424799 RepID=A0ABS5ELA8_9PROT|nr:DUF3592 domain-containing protein [Neoroseomonas terrae]MBR0651788.1 hypothetical protein [Neoroseomonas terrae]